MAHKKRLRKTSRNPSRKLQLENLESRELLATVSVSGGALMINGTNQADTVEVRMENSQMVVLDNSEVKWRGAPKLIFFMGRDGDDVFRNNTDKASFAYGHAGNDTLVGGSNIDRLVGGSGDDTVSGGSGNDHVYGDATAGGDFYNTYDSRPGQWGNDRVYGGPGINSMYGGGGNDTMYGGNDWDEIHGNAGHDVIYGLGGDDWLFGEEGNDIIHGGSGNDHLFGDEGQDYLRGEYGNDVLDGGHDLVRDTLVGDYEFPTNGDGRDTYVQHVNQERVLSTNNQYVYGRRLSEDLVVGSNFLQGDTIQKRVHYVTALTSSTYPIKTTPWWIL